MFIIIMMFKPDDFIMCLCVHRPRTMVLCKTESGLCGKNKCHLLEGNVFPRIIQRDTRNV